jgi:hypothetical protein
MSKSKESEPTVISKKEGQEQKNTLLRAWIKLLLRRIVS